MAAFQTSSNPSPSGSSDDYSYFYQPPDASRSFLSYSAAPSEESDVKERLAAIERAASPADTLTPSRPNSIAPSIVTRCFGDNLSERLFPFIDSSPSQQSADFVVRRLSTPEIYDHEAIPFEVANAVDESPDHMVRLMCERRTASDEILA